MNDKKNIDMETAQELMKETVDKFKEALPEEQILIIVSVGESDKQKILMGNTVENMNIADFSLSLFNLIGAIYNNLVLRKAQDVAKKELEKDKNV